MPRAFPRADSNDRKREHCHCQRQRRHIRDGTRVGVELVACREVSVQPEYHGALGAETPRAVVQSVGRSEMVESSMSTLDGAGRCLQH